MGQVFKTLAAIIIFGLTGSIWGILSDKVGEDQHAGEISGGQRPADMSVTAQQTQKAVSGRDKQILFGDLHVHSTFSQDAFLVSLPFLVGEGAHPPADACDFARYCSALDFFSINDHAESLTQRKWTETKDTIRACNATAGDPANPDMVAFLGWEWTQMGLTKEGHYGHKNVVLRDLEDDKVPSRPISSDPRRLEDTFRMPVAQKLGLPLIDFANRQAYFDYGTFLREIADTPFCPEGTVRDLPLDCREIAATPGDLFTKLDDWGFDSIVIPHGTAWANTSPANSDLRTQLNTQNHDPKRQSLIEVFSGHGNSEPATGFESIAYDDAGNASCPPAQDGFLPCCRRAGQIIEERCLAEGSDQTTCNAKAEQASADYVQYGKAGHNIVPGTKSEDWLMCDIPDGVFQPTFGLKHKGSAQYALSITEKDDQGEDLRYRFGFIGSSDNHSARAGTGYKEYMRQGTTDAAGAGEERFARLLVDDREPTSTTIPFNLEELSPLRVNQAERVGNFMFSGGLAAVHSDGRDRDAIWEAFQRRETYATSGPRLLLWFDRTDETGTSLAPMGSETQMGTEDTPRFTVRAAGAFKQKPGCPDYAENGLGEDRLQSLCGGECYHPGDERHTITQIEVVRIKPEQDGQAAEILDPWKTLPCNDKGDGCTVTFEDETYGMDGRDTLYYVRAIQEETQIINANTMRCTYDEDGNCIKVNPCYGDYRSKGDECLAPGSHRAWSSPIFVDFKG